MHFGGNWFQCQQFHGIWLVGNNPTTGAWFMEHLFLNRNCETFCEIISSCNPLIKDPCANAVLHYLGVICYRLQSSLSNHCRIGNHNVAMCYEQIQYSPSGRPHWTSLLFRKNVAKIRNLCSLSIFYFVLDRGVIEISVAVFCLKLVRYCMYMWLPMFLEKQVRV